MVTMMHISTPQTWDDANMSISELSSIKQALMNDLLREDEKIQDEYRQGVGTGLTMALMLIERMIESEDERMSREFGED